MPTQITRVPRWYWLAACVPSLGCGFVLVAAFRSKLYSAQPSDMLIMAGSVSVALGLLGYLPLALCVPPKPAEKASERGPQ